MTRKTRAFSLAVRSLLLVFFLAVGLATLSVARQAQAASGQNGYPNGIFAQGYYYDLQTGAWQSARGVADSSSLTTANILLSTFTKFTTGGRPNLKLSARFSNAGASCVARFVYTNETSPAAPVLLGVSSAITLTADTVNPVTDQSGLFMAPDFVADTGGAPHMHVLLHSVSAGTVTFFSGSN